MTDTAHFESATDAGNSNDGTLAHEGAVPAPLDDLSDDNRRVAETKG